MIKKTWKVFGRAGHRMHESFSESYIYDFSSKDEGIRVLEVLNSNVTGTNAYSVISVIRDTEELVESEFSGQITDGIFENSYVGGTESVVLDETYYVQTYLNFWQMCLDECKGNPEAATLMFDEKTGIDTTIGFYLYHHGKDAYKVWCQNTDGLDLSNQDKVVNDILGMF